MDVHQRNFSANYSKDRVYSSIITLCIWDTALVGMV